MNKLMVSYFIPIIKSVYDYTMITKWLIFYTIHNIAVDKNVSKSVTEDSNTVSGKSIIGIKVTSLLYYI